MTQHSHLSFSATVVFTTALCFTILSGPVAMTTATDPLAQEQRIEIVIRDYQFLLTKPVPIRLGLPTVIILRNEDIVRHGFTSPMLFGLLVHGEGEGIASYGKGVEGFYVDPGKTLAIRFTTERPGNYAFRCDLHPNMKGEFFMLEVPVA